MFEVGFRVCVLGCGVQKCRAFEGGVVLGNYRTCRFSWLFYYEI